MKIVFCGDTVLPFGSDVDYSELLPLFQDKVAVVNLEGNILPDESKLADFKWKDKYSVYSSPNVIQVLKDLNVKYASLCNNHIMDYKYPVQHAVDLLKKEGIAAWGLQNHDVMKSSLNGKPLYIITFATCANDHALNLYKPDSVVKTIRELKSKEDCYVVVYPHWGIEKFVYAEPADRQHAHRMMDAGADLIVGHHPHIMQQIEMYKGKPIVYSLGNFIFPQTYYGKKKLVFKQEEIRYEMIVDWDGKDIHCHVLYFDPDKNKLRIVKEANKHISFLSETVDDKIYCADYGKKVGKLNFYWARRMKDSDSAERWCYIRRQSFRMVRKILINLGLHQPK
jgi:poly-gamma-glutamate synthesis protein (capsule biosynthesis protein)